MEFAPPSFNLTKLKRKVDIRNVTILIEGENVRRKGRFFMLWKDGNYLTIQAEPWWRPGIPTTTPESRLSDFLEEHRALCYLQEVIQVMLDTIVFDGENNWAYLVRLPKGNDYRLVYAKRRLVRDHTMWTKVVELDDIELTRFVSGLFWEGIYEGQDVDLFIGWQDDWGDYISAESHGQKLVESRGIGRYFFELKAHVAKNGVIIGIMMEAIVGRSVTAADRAAVFEAVADIQRHGVLLTFLQRCDIYITDRGVRFASACNARYYQDDDKLAKEAECTWKTLTDIFNSVDNDPCRGFLSGSRTLGSVSFIIPRLPSPNRPMPVSPEEAIIRWVWSITISDEFYRRQAYAFRKLFALYGFSEGSETRRGKRVNGDDRILLPPDDTSGDSETPAPRRIECVDEPLAVNRIARHHPYARRASRRLLLPRESI